MHGGGVRPPMRPLLLPLPLPLLLFLLSALVSPSTAIDDLSRYELCYLRCVARCVQKGSLLGPCEQECVPYEKVNFCDPGDSGCWNVCKDLGVPETVNSPPMVHVDNSNGSRVIEWEDVVGSVLYAAQYRKTTGRFEEDKVVLSPRSSLENTTLPNGHFCDPFLVRVAAVSPLGVSSFTPETSVPAPEPAVSPLLKLISVRYSPEPFVADLYKANGTLIVTFEYDDKGWPLGYSDLTVTPFFNLITCQIADFSQGTPMAEFVPSGRPRELQARIGADQMYRRCRYVYYTQSAVSSRCGTQADYFTPPANSLQTLDINCSTVMESPCLEPIRIPGPVCGQIESSSWEYLTPRDSITADPSQLISINMSFVPIVRQLEAPTLYYKAVYGDAIEYSTPDQKAILGVNQTNEIGRSTNCPDGTECTLASETWLIINDLHLDQLYGVTICAIKNTANDTMPEFPGSLKASMPRSISVFLDSKDFVVSHTVLIVLVVVIPSIVIIAIIVVFSICRFRRIRGQNKAYQMKMTQMEQEAADSRYTDFPKKQDIWEVDRRNVDIYSSKKLGQGAFGAVYLGKLIGRSLGHHDANSPLGVNVMRTENCLVAIKTLPESADDASKHEFLGEIALMKSIGFHERLVNLLACVTESEPHLLIVEFCSDGDLLNFLKERRKYMLKLDELGINYMEPGEEDGVDLTQIVTLKQLLMFSVQISFGLEYLSQKGFVHRDVAARNILVSDGTTCKIGDFGLCRQIGRDEEYYKSRGGRLPLKWMSIEAIQDYEFSTKSDVWAFGVLLFEVITLGGSPYPDWRAADVLPNLQAGERIEQPDNCPDAIYSLMSSCWNALAPLRPDFSLIRQLLGRELEEVTEEYSYLKLDAQQTYYNVKYEGDGKIEIGELPAKVPLRSASSDGSSSRRGSHDNSAFVIEADSDV